MPAKSTGKAPKTPAPSPSAVSLDVFNARREPVGKVHLAGPLFSTPLNKALIHEAVVMQQASMRQGSADTKGRGEVSGSGKKPWKQKGTGRARAGSIRSPLWRGGGTVFGPTPRSYAYAFPRKKSRAALASAMSAKVTQGDVMILDRLTLSEPKTRAMVGLLETLGVDGSVLIVHHDESGAVPRASANLQRVTVIDPQRLNVYDVLAHRHIILVQSDLQILGEMWS